METGDEVESSRQLAWALRHAQALEHAQSALILLQEEIFAPGPDGRPPTEEELANKTDRLAVLGIAYHNIGVEQVRVGPR